MSDIGTRMSDTGTRMSDTGTRMSDIDIGRWIYVLDVRYIQVRVKKLVPNKKGDIGMKVYYLCQPNTYVIACEFGEQQ